MIHIKFFVQIKLNAFYFLLEQSSSGTPKENVQASILQQESSTETTEQGYLLLNLKEITISYYNLYLP